MLVHPVHKAKLTSLVHSIRSVQSVVIAWRTLATYLHRVAITRQTVETWRNLLPTLRVAWCFLTYFGVFWIQLVAWLAKFAPINIVALTNQAPRDLTLETGVIGESNIPHSTLPTDWDILFAIDALVNQTRLTSIVVLVIESANVTEALIIFQSVPMLAHQTFLCVHADKTVVGTWLTISIACLQGVVGEIAQIATYAVLFILA